MSTSIASSHPSSTTVYLPQLSAARPRSGMTSFAHLVDCLIRCYEAQSKVLEREVAPSGLQIDTTSSRPETQQTFDWY